MSCLFEFALLILGKKIESGSFIPPFLLHVTELRSIRNCEVQFCNSINVLHVSEIICASCPSWICDKNRRPYNTSFHIRRDRIC